MPRPPLFPGRDPAGGGESGPGGSPPLSAAAPPQPGPARRAMPSCRASAASPEARPARRACAHGCRNGPSRKRNGSRISGTARGQGRGRQLDRLLRRCGNADNLEPCLRQGGLGLHGDEVVILHDQHAHGFASGLDRPRRAILRGQEGDALHRGRGTAAARGVHTPAPSRRIRRCNGWSAPSSPGTGLATAARGLARAGGRRIARGPPPDRIPDRRPRHRG